MDYLLGEYWELLSWVIENPECEWIVAVDQLELWVVEHRPDPRNNDNRHEQHHWHLARCNTVSLENVVEQK